jgi:glycosyltransferase involved in cell wall biosynthesis
MRDNLVEVGISVVLPAHGKVNYLSETLDSIMRSTSQPNEILLVDDGFDLEVATQVRLNFPDVRVIPNEGKGLVDALNTGIRNSRYDLIARIDADDLMEPERLEIQMRDFRSNANLMLLGSQVKYIDDFGRLNGQSAYPVGDITAQTRTGAKCLIAHPSVMFRRDAVISVGAYRHIFRIDNVDLSEDFDLWIRMSRVGLVINSEDSLTRYRQHGSQLSIVHRLPQELSTYYVRAVSKYENVDTQSAPHIEIHHSDLIDLSIIKFVFDQIGFIQALRFCIEFLAFKKVIGFRLRRILTRILRF